MIRVLLVDDQELVRSGFRIILESEVDIEVVGEAANGADAVELASTLMPDVICMDVEMPVMNGIDASRAILTAAGQVGLNRASSPAPAPVQAPAQARTHTPVGESPLHPAAPAILILTTFGHEDYLFDALAAGVSGFLLKTSRAEQLIEAVRTLASGQALLGPDVTRAVIERLAQERSAPTAADMMGTNGTHPQPSAGSGAGTGTGTGVDDSAGAGPGVDDGAGDRKAQSQRITALANAGFTEREQQVLMLLAGGSSNAEIAASLFLGEATVKTHVSKILQKLGVRDRIQAVVWAHTHNVLD